VHIDDKRHCIDAASEVVDAEADDQDETESATVTSK
jgi:hypothetical protein